MPGRVVIIEDNADIAYLLGVLLSNDYDVVTLYQPSAIGSFKESVAWDYITAVVCDYWLGNRGHTVNGEEILSWLAEQHPSIRRVLVTAIRPVPIVNAHVTLEKPFSTSQLLTALDPANEVR